MQLSLRPSFRFDASALWLPRLASVALFIALCALVTYWVLTFSAMRTIPVPKSARVAQTEAVETGAVATLFGGSAQAGPSNVQLLGVVAELGGGTSAAIVSIDGGPAKAVRMGADLAPQLRLVEVRQRAVVIERNGVRQEIALPLQAAATRGAPRAASPLPTPPAGAAAPMATPMPPPAQAAQPAPAQPPRGQPPGQAAQPQPQAQPPAQQAQQQFQPQPQPQPVDPRQYQSVMSPEAADEGQLTPKGQP
ncbi:type II secretion system protein N [Cupriavidus taiwanensis]|uniref:type II secretion system protein N n=1 Tax=Cupriavidus taiwanensis TaxID=164546 RepID=UPI000E1079E8|nr:type II secretion system protein N [Cupriavidus taiwanensis]SOY52591.1 putative General Secretory Pathway protein C, type II secretion system [Cupriavidus taiwanensis]SOY52760.1 putative General Secretory Pathway protein C, type II secretion system [Cupriavidus taiwanensis]SOY85591.1 putative General Secretory Pathway protein C, type II secretion system [Cupriavidus taiwanensis]SOZ60121.1 putative General Secretory Pathway protein C, type II secretion system [Cupriavidus taiwanensis]SOZ8048